MPEDGLLRKRKDEFDPSEQSEDAAKPRPLARDRFKNYMEYCSAQYVSTEPNDGKCQIKLGGWTSMDINLPEIINLVTVDNGSETPSSSNDDSINVRLNVDNVYSCMKFVKCVTMGELP